jgi:hypothetical protein
MLAPGTRSTVDGSSFLLDGSRLSSSSWKDRVLASSSSAASSRPSSQRKSFFWLAAGENPYCSHRLFTIEYIRHLMLVWRPSGAHLNYSFTRMTSMPRRHASAPEYRRSGVNHDGNHEWQHQVSPVSKEGVADHPTSPRTL